MEKVYIAIINYKSENVIQDAIKSINEESIHTHIIILDNESTSNSYLKLKSQNFDKVDIIRSKKNLGFPAGCNRIFKYIQQKYDDNKYIFLLNPDAVLPKNIIDTLLKILLSDKNIAAISPRIVTNEDVNWYTGTKINWEKCTINNNPNSNMNNTVRKVDIFNGCAVLLDSKKFYDVNMFNEELFLYYEEAFLSMKLIKNGYKIFYEPNLKVIHRVSYSTSEAIKNYYITRNHVYFFKKFGINRKSVFCLYKTPLINIKHNIKYFNYKNLFYIMLAIWHTIIGKKGVL